ncbi:hypothetical protein GCM10007417_15220 [Glycocaulis alkaliphilus]|nr:hypothetical protein GCM10007417_15220 [Glycocaulis alkaliphilus]
MGLRSKGIEYKIIIIIDTKNSSSLFIARNEFSFSVDSIIAIASEKTDPAIIYNITNPIPRAIVRWKAGLGSLI